mmetsp:Transcript_11160/g.46475  ORF Transcript_11160/g.46475 Transcript_11160/m.46475 type:complete len:330 (+) Transcript_11160:1668-2657(+)
MAQHARPHLQRPFVLRVQRVVRDARMHLRRLERAGVVLRAGNAPRGRGHVVLWPARRDRALAQQTAGTSQNELHGTGTAAARSDARAARGAARPARRGALAYRAAPAALRPQPRPRHRRVERLLCAGARGDARRGLGPYSVQRVGEWRQCPQADAHNIVQLEPARRHVGGGRRRARRDARDAGMVPVGAARAQDAHGARRCAVQAQVRLAVRQVHLRNAPVGGQGGRRQGGARRVGHLAPKQRLAALHRHRRRNGLSGGAPAREALHPGPLCLQLCGGHLPVGVRPDPAGRVYLRKRGLLRLGHPHIRRGLHLRLPGKRPGRRWCERGV